MYIPGVVTLWAALAFLAASTFFYVRAARGDAHARELARQSYGLATFAVVLTAVILLYLLLAHDFRINYVYSYSDRELPTPYLVSAFWAGQEGSFLFWLLSGMLIGLPLIRFAREYENEALIVFNLTQLALIVILIRQSPFRFITDLPPGQTPADGAGLNPLLQNPWMTIHPPVMFVGYAATAVPFAFALAGLWKRRYDDWVAASLPWALLTVFSLGAAIALGGYWAYVTLGWGGYWGWDPVENSSLVPWLVAIAAIHTVLSQRKSGAFVRTTLFLGMLCFLMVLYSTFLTRSGVLGDTSVHSFVDPGMLVYWLLVGLIALFGGIGIGLLAIRWKDIPKAPPRHNYYSREFALFLGASALVIMAVLVSVGTSSPLITDILYGKKSAMDTSYYVTTTVPLGILISLLAGIGQLLWWTRSDRKVFFKSLIVPAVLGLVLALAITIAAGVEPLVGVLLFAAGFALFANLSVGWTIVKGNPKFAGGSVAHVGVAIMIIGFVASSRYDRKETVSLTQGKPTDILGYTLTYVGYRPVDSQKYAFAVDVQRGSERYQVAPIMYYSSYNDGLMRNPDILNLITKDFYVAPLSLEQKSEGSEGLQKVELRKGQTKRVGELDVTFTGFDFPEDQRAAMMEGRDVRIGAILDVKPYGGKVERLEPVKLIRRGETSDQPAQLGDRYEFTVSSMRPDREAQENMVVELGVRDLKAAGTVAGEGDVLVAEASVKPFINLVWSGVIVLLVGFLVTIVRRSQEALQRRAS